MTDARIILAVAGALYGVGLGLALVGLRRESPVWRRGGTTLFWLGFVAQSCGLYTRGLERSELPVANVFEILQVIGWGVVAVDILLRLSTRVRLPDALVAGVAVVFSAVSFAVGSWDGAASAAFSGNPWVGFHVGAIVLAFSFFAALALNSVAYLVQHRSLTRRRPGLLAGVLPPLRQLDRVGVQLLGAGLGLLTLSLAVGFAGYAQAGAAATSFKLVVAALVWVGYAVVFALRRKDKLSGRGFARSCLALFLLALFSLWPANSLKKPTAADATVGLVTEGARE